MDLKESTVAEIALAIPGATEIFEELKIDYCCNGDDRFVEACESAGTDPEAVAIKISALDTEKSFDSSEHISPAQLIDSIVENHHSFTRREIDRLQPLLEKVMARHVSVHPFLRELSAVFDALCDDLLPHLHKEEAILFPYIKRIEAAGIAGDPSPPAPFGTVRNPIRMMKYEHDTAGDLLKKLRKTANNYKSPEDACPSFELLLKGLEALERDLHQHIHLENNVLFPRAVEIEEAN